MARILVIEDDPMLRRMINHQLQSEGHEVFEAPNGALGLKALEEKQADLVITDIFMPEKEGIETIMEVREKYPQAKIIAISGGGRLESVNYLELARNLGAHKIFQKPVKREELLDAVHELLKE